MISIKWPFGSMDLFHVTPSAEPWSVLPFSGPLGLDRADSAWRCALSQAATERIFLEPEWIRPWLRAYDAEPRMLFATNRRGAWAGAILAQTGLGTGAGGAVILRPPGLGVSDYIDLLLPADVDAAAAAMAAMLDWLIKVGGWDIVDLPNLPAEHPTPGVVLTAAKRRGLIVARVETHRRPFVTLDDDWQTYLASRRPKLRYSLRARRRQLDSLGQLRYCHYTGAADISRRLGEVVAVHARRWQGQRTSTTFSSSARARRFYSEALDGLAGRGFVDLSTLELDGTVVAFCLGFIYGQKLYYYLPAFEPAFARFGPSTALLVHLIEHAYGLGLRELDFMLGEEPYKLQWATGCRTTCRILIAAPTVRGRAALTAAQTYHAIHEHARRSSSLQRARRYGLRRLLGR